MADGYSCYYCDFVAPIKTTIQHSVESHPHKVLKVRQRLLDEATGKTLLQTKNFSVIPEDVLKQNEKFCVDEQSLALSIISEEEPSDIDVDTILEKSFQNLSVENPDVDELFSPAHKIMKTSTPAKVCFESDHDTEEDFNENLEEINELRELIPSVVSVMKKHGYLKAWMDFNRMIK